MIKNLYKGPNLQYSASRVLTLQHILLFQGKYYEQVDGVSIGSLVSTTVSKIYMEHFKEVALRTVENPHRLWKIYVDDTYVIQYTEHKENFLLCINTINQAIKYTVEDTSQMVPCYL